MTLKSVKRFKQNAQMWQTTGHAAEYEEMDSYRRNRLRSNQRFRLTMPLLNYCESSRDRQIYQTGVGP